MDFRTVIVGAGQAGAQLAFSLREEGVTGPVALIGDELRLPYNRPPLSKGFLAGTLAERDLPLRPADYYEQLDIGLRLGTEVAAIDRGSRTLALADGGRLGYDHLVLATGARNRRLPGLDGAPNVRYLRTYDDAAALRSALAGVRDVVVVGAGFIGLEFASVAADSGHRVTVLEMAPRVLGRAVSAETAEFFAARHRAAGTEVLAGTGIDEFVTDGTGAVSAVIAGGRKIAADLVVVGIGVLPNEELAAAAGLPTENGVVTDAQLRTSDPAISALGDCARYPHPAAGGTVRLESVQNAADQARFLARRLAGATGGYAETPWFWSHQCGQKLQIAGLSGPDDDAVAVGDVDGGRFSVLRFRDGVLVAAESVNSARDHLAARKAFAAGRRVRRDEIGSPGSALRDVLTSTAGTIPA